MFVTVLHKVVFQFLIDLLFFPVWWYSNGLAGVSLGLWHRFQSGRMRLAPGLWFRNIFTPMFGQTDWQGRLTSFIVRLMNVFARGIALGIWFLLLVFLLLLWLVWPLFLVGMIGWSLMYTSL